MFDGYRVSVPQMEADENEIRTLIQEIPKQIRELESTMHRLQACWEGNARNAFQVEVRADIAFMNEVYQFLVQYLEKMSESGEEYFNAEYQAYKEVHGLWI